MPDVVRAKLTEALRDQHAMAYDAAMYYCDCGMATGGYRVWADHMVDVLLSLEGVAIVELPTRVGSRWPVDDEDDFAVSTVELVRASDAFAATPRRHPGCKVEWGSVELNLCTRDARALAAALLAAAAAAERR
ncbi:hypothetical protein A5656_28410 [Mycobacterium gordonae]|nr:hypothetical protein [Mycobacterium gordonae]OBK49411.1 hypothetical protein A5656_28410 [Mycobacterium gordonae]